METFFFSHSPLHETSKVLTLEILIRIFWGLFWTYISQLRENIDYIWIHYIAASFRSSYYNIQNLTVFVSLSANSSCTIRS